MDKTTMDVARRTAALASVAMILGAGQVHALAYPYPVEKRVFRSLDFGWRFYKGVPSGTPSDSSYPDGSWTTVDVPHSPSYDEPLDGLSAPYYKGTMWYRRHFTVRPNSPAKTFVEFQGASITAEVWVNGKRVGMHGDSYTGFSFDITGFVNRGGDNLIAVRVINTLSPDLPPGTTADFKIFGGFYRDIWLVQKDSLHLPYFGQQISTLKATASSAVVRTQTKVQNDYKSDKTFTLQVNLLDSNGVQVGTKSVSETLPAGGSKVVDLSLDAISGAKLWTPETPYLYKVSTKLILNGVTADDQLDRIGIRTITWSATNGMSLNGQRYQMIGTCDHQDFAWVEYAIPRSRFYAEINLMKKMGVNAVRLSHYPRDPAFYDALDRMGMLATCEAPAWAYGTKNYSATYWANLDSAAKQMVVQARNHAAIFIYGVHNEISYDCHAEIQKLTDICHANDSTRSTYFAWNGDAAALPAANAPPMWAAVDVVGLNYQLGDNVTSTKPIFASEYHVQKCPRGNEGNQYSDVSNKANSYENRRPRVAGYFVWDFADYKGNWNTTGMVDIYRIPKNAFWQLRKKWTGLSDLDGEIPVAGSATKVQLDADVKALRSDNSDFTTITASLRDNSGKCIIATNNITFKVSDTSILQMFGTPTLAAIAGRIAVVCKATRKPGTVTVTATSAGLTMGTKTITTNPVAPGDTSSEAGSTGIRSAASRGRAANPLTWRATSEWIYLSAQAPGRVSILDMAGRVVQAFDVGDKPLAVSRKDFRPGVYCARFEGDGIRQSMPVNLVR